MASKSASLMDNVVEFIKTRKEVNTKDVAEHFNKKIGHAGVILSKLAKLGKIKRVRLGIYALNMDPTPKKSAPSNHLDPKPGIATTYIPTNAYDSMVKNAEDNEILLHLKKIHGREELIKLLHQWIKILE